MWCYNRRIGGGNDMGQRHILHCDCNYFYASVEMQEHPELRGKSIAVCGDPEARHGIVLTASYPAKRMGVKTAIPIWEAKQHCRDLIVVPASYGKYQKYSSYVREIFRDYTDQVESFGLDEAWLDITGSLGLFGDPVKIAKEISDRIKRELEITVSIGVSFNKITAKLGSDYKKPDAITVIEPDTYKQIVYPLPVGDLLYVGNATQRKLGSYGIRTIGQLAETNPEVLKGWFGVMGYTLSAFARGLDQTPIAKQDAHSAIKSVGNSATTPRDLTTDEDVWLMLVLLSESVAMRMRDLGSKCNVVEVYVRDNELSGFTRRRKQAQLLVAEAPARHRCARCRLVPRRLRSAIRIFFQRGKAREAGAHRQSRGHPAPALRLPQCTAGGRIHRPRFGRHQRLRRPQHPPGRVFSYGIGGIVNDSTRKALCGSRCALQHRGTIETLADYF